MAEMKRSTRHSKIIGNLGEHIICNWLSRSGFEALLVDHTGIDILACNQDTKKRYGITVKSRTRVEQKENDSLFIFQDVENDRKKLRTACESFACDQWIAVYVETSCGADIYLTSVDNYDRRYANPNAKTQSWLMSDKQKRKYEEDSRVKHIKVAFELTHWDTPWE